MLNEETGFPFLYQSLIMNVLDLSFQPRLLASFLLLSRDLNNKFTGIPTVAITKVYIIQDITSGCAY